MLKHYCIFIFSLTFFFAKAQDVRFSQFYSSPMMLNPSLTGLFLGDHRITANYRSQWVSANADYITTAFSYDNNVLSNKEKSDIIGLGVVVFDDKSGFESGINTFTTMLSGAYHLPVGKNSTLAMGFQANFVQKSTFGDYHFPNQWLEGVGYDPSAGGDVLQITKINAVDFNTGAFFYTFPGGGNSSAFLGMSLFHLAQPKESFIPVVGNNLSRRLVVHGGTRITTKRQINFVPNLLYMKQGTADELNVGFSTEIEFPKIQTVFVIGFWGRAGDALIPNMAVDYKNIHVGVSYDFNLSGFEVSSGKRGGTEISFIYIFNNNQLHSTKAEPCPRF